MAVQAVSEIDKLESFISSATSWFSSLTFPGQRADQAPDLHLVSLERLYELEGLEL
jgi:hypothetical protein